MMGNQCCRAFDAKEENSARVRNNALINVFSYAWDAGLCRQQLLIKLVFTQRLLMLLLSRGTCVAYQ